MKNVVAALKRGLLTTTMGFFILNVFLVWLKTYWSYHENFSLGVAGSTQQFLLFFNPIPTAIILIGIGLYFRGKIAYWIMLLMNLIQSVWLFSNMLYYREFSDFLSMNIMTSGGSAGDNLSKALGGLIKPTDFLVFVDIIIIIALLGFSVIKIDHKRLRTRVALSLTTLGFVLMFAGYGLAEKDRSGLLTRTFDNNYIVKYLGLNEYAAYNIYKTQQTAKVRNKAVAADLEPVQKFVKDNQTTPNPEYFGQAKGKNVIMFHLESFQQFLIDYKVDGEEVTPNLNKFYHDQSTLAFDNVYNQVGQGKTADAEMMLETGLFGTASGSAMVNYGTTNTFQAVPGILGQKGYTSASFHGAGASFWNRDNTYKSWGYDFFFSKPFYKYAEDEKNNYGYGLKDKLFLKETAGYLDQMPQPFYSKIITVSNHYPYDFDEQNISIKKTNTGSKTVDGYVQTARYLDQAFGEFLQYLKDSGLYDDTLLVLYGDHYGISENHPKAIATLLGKDEINDVDLMNWQKVPFMMHAPGIQGYEDHTYGGEIDIMPTVLNLLGVSTKDNIIFGQDMLSKDNKQIVSFRNGNWVTDKYMRSGSKYYDMKSGKEVYPETDEAVKKYVKKTQDHVNATLMNSDAVQTSDLLRFHDLENFTPVKPRDYSYKVNDTMDKLKTLEKDHETVIKKNKGKETSYTTDAPEIGGKPQTIKGE